MLQPGRRLGDRYRLDARIGAGGMGEVWRATDEVLGRVVAVKVMLAGVAADPTFARRFLTEAKAMAGVNHPAVTAVHDYGTSDGAPYLVMEFVDGESLAQVLGRHGRLTAAQTMQLVARAADGLSAVHEQGIVHRDIKPANLLVRRDGSVLITDFGIARIEGATPLTTAGAVLGTPTYLAPEQVLGQPATALSDVYSLGLTAYECLAGHRPFAGDNPYAVALQRIQSAPRTLAADLPRAVLAVVERALAPAPADRWPSAAGLAAAARAAAAGTAAPPPVPAAAPPRSWRRPAMLIGAVMVLALGGFLAWKAVHPGSGRDQPRDSPGAATPEGFAACDAGLCPAEPTCWGGLTVIGGKAQPLGRTDCDDDHEWETFAALPLPSGALDVRQETLIARPDVAAACSADVMARHSTDPDATSGWRRDAWPMQVGGTWLLLCIAAEEAGGSQGAAFR